MSKYFIIFLKGLIALIWFVATVVTTVLLSPFVLASWISRKLDKNQNNDDNHSSTRNDGH